MSDGVRYSGAISSRIVERVAMFDERKTFDKLQGYLDNELADLDEGSSSGEERDSTGDNDDDDYDDDDESGHSGEYDDVIDKVSQKLVQTESQLIRSNSRLKESDGKLKMLERELTSKNLEVQDKIEENRRLRQEIDRLRLDVVDRDEGRARPDLEARLRKAVDFLKKDLTASQEKCIASQTELRAHRNKIELIEETNQSLLETIRVLEKKHRSKDEQLAKYIKELKEAREQSTNLTEEVAEVRDELWRNGKIEEEKDQMMKREIENRVKEKIKLEVREEISKEVAERTAKQVRAAFKIEKDKEINSLREQFKKVFKEHAALKRQVEANADASVRLRRVEERDIPAFKVEIERLLTVIDENNKTHEDAIADLESYYRTKIQSLKEEAATEKWKLAADIRKQMSKDRDREVNDFTQRIEALSMQTDRLMQRAEKEKEEYADQVRKRVVQEKEREIQSLTDKLATVTRESEELLREAVIDKEAYADQIRQQMAEERKRQVNKLSYRIEVMTRERETLIKRISAFEEELSWTWKEQERNLEKMHKSHSVLGSSEDDMFQLKRKNQSLATMVKHYRSRYEEAKNELLALQEHVRGSAEPSDDASFNLQDRVQQLELDLKDARKDYADVVAELEDVKSDLFDSIKGYEQRISGLMEEGHDNTSPASSVQDLLSSVKAENTRLKRHVEKLEQICRKNGEINENASTTQRTNYTVASDQETVHSIQMLQEEIAQLNQIIDQYKFNCEELDKSNERLKQEIQLSTATIEDSESEIENLRGLLEDADAQNIDLNNEISLLMTSLEACQDELAKVSNELEAAKVVTKSAQDTEIEVALLRNEISRLKARLECCQCDATVPQKREGGKSVRSTSENSTTTSAQETQKLSRDILVQSDDAKEQHDNPNSEEQIIHERANDDESASEPTSCSKVETPNVNVSDMIQPSSHTVAHQLNKEIESLKQSLESKEKENSLVAVEATTATNSELQNLTVKVDELAGSLRLVTEQRDRAQEELRAYQDENKILLQKIQDLTMTLNASRKDLSRVSNQLKEEKEKTAAEEASAKQLRERIDRLTLILETTDRNRAKDSFTLDDTKKRLDETLEEIEDLQSEVARLTNALSSARAEVDQANRELRDSKEEFRNDLKEAEAASCSIQDENGELRSKLLLSEEEIAKTKNELLHSKRLFHEALMKSEKKIVSLETQIESLSQKAENSQHEVEKVAKQYVVSNNELKVALRDAERRYQDKIRQLEHEIDNANDENDRLTIDLQNLENEFVLASREFENDKKKIEAESQILKEDLFACNRENLDVAKELQHSRQLFKEAMMAWRVETRELTHQISMLRHPDHVGGMSASRDSLSVQTQSQTDYDQSTYDESTYNDASRDQSHDRCVIIKAGASRINRPISATNGPRGLCSSKKSVETATDDDKMASVGPTVPPAPRKSGENPNSSSILPKKVTWNSGATMDLNNSETKYLQSDRASDVCGWDQKSLRVIVSTEEPFDEADGLHSERSSRNDKESRRIPLSLSSSVAFVGRGSMLESRYPTVASKGSQQDDVRLPSRRLNEYIDKGVCLQRRLDEESRDDVQSNDGSLFSYLSASNNSRLSSTAQQPYMQDSTLRNMSMDEDDEQAASSCQASASSSLQIRQHMEMSGRRILEEHSSKQSSLAHRGARPAQDGGAEDEKPFDEVGSKLVAR